MVQSPPLEKSTSARILFKRGEKGERENAAPPLLNCVSFAKEFRTDSSAVNRALTMDREEPEPNHRARCSHGSARIIVPFRKPGFRGTLIISHLNQPFIISLLPF